jgi:hypothetical protein
MFFRLMFACLCLCGLLPMLPSCAHAASATMQVSAPNPVERRLFGAKSAVPFVGRDAGQGARQSFGEAALELSPLPPLHEAPDTSRQSTDAALQKPQRELLTGVNSRLYSPLGPFQLSVASGEGSGAASLDPLTIGKLGITPSVGVYNHSDQYFNDYLCLLGRRADGGKQREYESREEMSPFVGLTLDLSISQSWSAFLNGEVAFPGDRLREGNNVDSASTQSVTTGFVYTFW